MTQHSPALWDSIATRYDGMRPDQGLTDPSVRAAWLELIERRLPPLTTRILDVGCGTGSLSVLLADAGYTVTGIDFAPAMVEVARSKASTATFLVQDAAAPAFALSSFDAIVSRQVLWALPDRAAALANWAALVRPGGTVVLVEGRFASGNGMTADEIANITPASLEVTEATDLSGDTSLWGAALTDQRLLVVARRRDPGTEGSGRPRRPLNPRSTRPGADILGAAELWRPDIAVTPSASLLLQALTRNELLELADILAIEVADRRAKAPLVEALSGVDASERAELLGTLPRARLKALCRSLGLDDSGKAKADIVARLLAHDQPRARTKAKAPSQVQPAPKKRQPPSPPPKPSSAMTTNASQLAAYI